MADKITPGVIVASKFISSGSKAFGTYIEYIDRDDAIRNKGYEKYDAFHNKAGYVQQDTSSVSFGGYTDYMGNPKKTSALFDANHDQLQPAERNELKSAFETAQKNGSLMWQTVLSFDNAWLADNGVFDPETRRLNEEQLRSLTRKAMSDMLLSEKLTGSAVWSASIHYNTDNVHIHIATVEPVPMRKKKIIYGKEQFVGRMKLSSLDKMKSDVANGILNNREINLQVTQIMREGILAQRANEPMTKDTELRKQFLAIYESMPENKRYWRYNMNELSQQRPEIDKLTTMYLEKYHAEDFAQLKNTLAVQDEKYQRAYGNTGKTFSEGKIHDLYARIGNSILTEMRAYDRDLKNEQRQHEISRGHVSRNNPVAPHKNAVLDKAMAALAGLTADDYESKKNQFIFEMDEAERERQQQREQRSDGFEI